MQQGSYLLCSLDVGGSSDPAAIAVALVSRQDRLTRARILHMEVVRPVVTPTRHIALVQEVMEAITYKATGRGVTRYVVDVSNNSAIAFLLAQALPRSSLVGCRITGGESHGAGLQPLAVGDVNGRATAIPTMNLSRRQMLLDLGVALQSKQLTLPLDDPEMKGAVQELKSQMNRASLKTTPSGKKIARVQSGHDDLLLAVAQLWCCTRLPAPRDPTGAALAKAERETPTALGWT